MFKCFSKAILLGWCVFLYFISNIPVYSEVPVKIYTLPGEHQEDGFWISIHAASNNNVYFGTCTHGGVGHFYEFDSKTNTVHHIAGMDEATSENVPYLEPQGKIHCKIVEDKRGRIWFGSDIAYHFYMAKWDAPDGYPGGHMLVYDPKTKQLDDLGIPFPRASIRVLSIDQERDVLYVVTFPDGRFYKYEIQTKKSEFFGRVNNCDSIGRMLVKDDQGNVYGTFAPYRIFKYDRALNKLMDLPVTIPHLEGPWCDKGHYHRENVWRDAFWHPTEKVLYGIEMGSATLFRFNPESNKMDDLGQLVIPEYEGNRIVPESSHSLLYHAGLDRIIYSAPTYRQHKRNPEPRHFITYNTKTNEKIDHGELMGTNMNSFPVYTEGISIGPDGTIYYCGQIFHKDAGERPWRGLGLVVLNPSDVQ